MDMFVSALGLFFQLPVFLATFFGVGLGVVLGSIPGLTATMAIALIVPMTFTLSPIVSIGMLVGAYKGGCFGGSIPAILLNTPGTPAAAATSLDGHALAKKGHAYKALRVALFSSVLADSFSDIVLILVAPPLAMIALKMGPPEMTGLVVFSLLIITAVAGDSMIKGLISGVLGLLVGIVGLDPIMATRRFGFHFTQLDEGVSLMPMLIGLFALSEFFIAVESIRRKKAIHLYKISTDRDQARLTRDEKIACGKIIGLASAIGTVLGAVPGIGPSIAAFASYAQAKKMSKKTPRVRPRIHRRDIRSRGRQQRRSRGQPHPFADPGHPRGCGGGPAPGGLHDPGHASGPHAVQGEPGRGLCHFHGPAPGQSL